MAHYFDSNNPDCAFNMYRHLSDTLRHSKAFTHPIIIMCIGSDRSTGDSLGPMVGYKLSKYTYKNVYIWGTLHEPVHATNLEHALATIKSTYVDPYIIAIDASLGKCDHIGYITIGTGPLKPGLGVKKRLPEVGDIHITGIVNTSSNMNNILLQTTRLSYIMTIADAISSAIVSTMCSNQRLSAYPYTPPLPDQQFQQYRIS